MSNSSNEDLLFDGELEVFPITDNLHDEVIEFYKKEFLTNENISIALDIAGSEHALAEIEAVKRVVLQDNLGYVVRHCKSKDIVAICVNKMLNPSSDSLLGFQFESPAIIRGAEVVYQVKSSYDIFKEWNIDCAMEIVFLSTRKDFGGRGLATILSVRSIGFARQMLAGTLAQEQKDALPEHVRELRPQAVCSIFSSLYTQKMGEKLEFETFVEIPYADLFYEGKSFAESIDPKHKTVTFAGKKL